MKSLTLHDITQKFIGETTPLGCASRDKERLYNTLELLELIGDLMENVRYLSTYADSHESSVKEIGLKAKTFRETFKENYL